MIVALVIAICVAAISTVGWIEATANSSSKNYVADFDPGWMEKKIYDNEARIDKMNFEIFKLKNPPKYQIGQEVMVRGYRGYIIRVENNPGAIISSELVRQTECRGPWWEYAVFIPSQHTNFTVPESNIIPLKTKKNGKKSR